MKDECKVKEIPKLGKNPGSPTSQKHPADNGKMEVSGKKK